MTFLVLALIGLLVGLTTVLFGFGGGFVTVPIVAVADASMGGDAVRVATATSALVMLVNAAVATASTRRDVLGRLRGRAGLFVLLVVGGALGAEAARFAPDGLIRWGFVVYVGATVVDLLVRPGFLRSDTRPVVPRSDTRPTRQAPDGAGVRTVLGLPIGAVAAFLGVGGSVMTVPVMRRAGASMPVATALANPLTLAIAAPAVLVTLLAHGTVPAAPGLVGAVDVLAAAALLIGAMPVIVVLRRRPPRIPEAVHAWGYVLLLGAAGVAVAVG
ncbi:MULTISPECIES: sulfite exporter TauE/SafE family protein [unclassified Curtobacterium]|uniref:sulfite exporter TauE/SafE family protein n=1 Tax=unclassified Curtobacterium TaxID=257496 RepID=UPI00380E430C